MGTIEKNKLELGEYQSDLKESQETSNRPKRVSRDMGNIEKNKLELGESQETCGVLKITIKTCESLKRLWND